MEAKQGCAACSEVTKKAGNGSEDLKTIVLKVPIHCHGCEVELKKKLNSLEGVHTVKTDMEDQSCTVVGTMDAEKLVKFIYKNLKKRAEAVPVKDSLTTSGSQEKDGDKGEKDIKAIYSCCCCCCCCQERCSIPLGNDSFEENFGTCRVM